MSPSYVGLPAQSCPTCKGRLFARVHNRLCCPECQPLQSVVEATEWLLAEYRNGVLRWSLASAPRHIEPTLWLFVAENLDWLECEPTDRVGEVWHHDCRWWRRLDQRLLGWLWERVSRLERQSFREDFDEALTAISELVERAIEIEIFGPEFSDRDRWPKTSGGFDPFGGLPEIERIIFN